MNFKNAARRLSNFCSYAGFLVVFLIVFGIPSAQGQQGSMASRLEHTEKEPQNWLTFYGNYKGWSYSPLNQITRENEVLQMLASGFANKTIAARLKISEHTVKFHVASILGKLGAGSRTEAVSLGIRRGLVML